MTTKKLSTFLVIWILCRILARMSITIYSTDTFEQIAKKVWDNLRVNESIDIHGWAMNEVSQLLSPLGDLVLEYMRYLDEVDNISYGKSGKRQRKLKYEKGGIGGPLAQKIFKWQKVTIDNNPRVTIWRIQ